MELEILLSAMNQTDFSIVVENNITSDVIIINQTDHITYQKKQFGGFEARMYSFDDVGVGKSRNQALMQSQAAICLLSDDDVVYRKDYETIILNEFEQRPDADMIIFDLNIIQDSGFNYVKNKNEQVHHFNLLNHGAPKIAFKRESIRRANISFSLLFGGGARYGAGEDSLFIKSALDGGLNVISVDKAIADVYNDDSSWFTGFNEKYLLDRGAIMKALYPKFWPLVCRWFVEEYHDEYKGVYTKKEMFLKIIEGVREYDAYMNQTHQALKQTKV